MRFLLSDRGAMPGLSKALLQAEPGGTYRIILPPHLAHGEEGLSVPPNATLILIVTLLTTADANAN